MSSNERFHPQGGSRPSVFLGLMLGLVLAIGMGLLSSAFSQDTATSTQADTSALTVAESADHGQYLTDNSGRAIYIFLNDTSGMSMCEGECLQNWPPVVVSSADQLPTLPEGMDASMLSTIERSDGTLQLVYNGWPLYYFVGDTGPDMTTGQGQGDVWYLLSTEGTGVGRGAEELGGGAAPEGGQ